MTNSKQKLVLASGSLRRLELLHQIGIEPTHLIPRDIDETPAKLEHPRTLCCRLSLQKAEAALKNEQTWKDAYVLGSDTVVAVGRRIVGKAEYAEDASAALHLLSGRSHWVYTGICLVTPGGKIRQKMVKTKVHFKRLSTREIDAYIASGQWRGKTGAYGIQGIAGAFVQKLTGSYTNVVGLPLYETMSLLSGEGFEVTSGWFEG